MRLNVTSYFSLYFILVDSTEFDILVSNLSEREIEQSRDAKKSVKVVYVRNSGSRASYMLL